MTTRKHEKAEFQGRTKGKKGGLATAQGVIIDVNNAETATAETNSAGILRTTRESHRSGITGH